MSGSNTIQQNSNNATELRNKIISDIKLRLGDGMIDIELDPPHYHFAIDRAIKRYRQRSDNSMEESFLFLDIQPECSEYTLPQDVQEVRSVYRRTFGSTGNGGSSIDPFALAGINSFYMMGMGGNMGGLGGNMGSSSNFMATFDFATAYQQQAMKQFGGYLQYTWNASTKMLRFERKFLSGGETIAIHVFNAKPESVLFNDPYASLWIQDFSYAQCLLILAQSRGKFGTLAGPQGGVQLNASDLRQEANEEILRLDKELTDLVDSHYGFSMIIG